MSSLNVQTKQIYLQCVHCGHSMFYERPLAACSRCGENILKARYDLQMLRETGWIEKVKQREKGLWRYHELLPLHNTENIVSLGEGGTPLLHARNLGMMLGLKNLYIKDERQGPTHSFKDRQASVAISVMREQGIGEAVLASTGNVAIAYSAYAARAGIKIWAFLTSMVPGEKMREAAIYGGEVIKVTGTYDQAKIVAESFARSKGLYMDKGIKSIAAVESMKTLAYEIAQQLDWRSPDWFIQAVSGGMGPLGVAKGFEELIELGLVDRMPALGIVQASGCAPMINAYKGGRRVATPVENPQTLVATLSTGNPGRSYELLFDLINEHGGTMEDATDEETFNALRLLARTEGLSVEPATAVAFAGLIKLARRGIIKQDELVVINCSGHTFPVEKHILGDEFARHLDVSAQAHRILAPRGRSAFGPGANGRAHPPGCGHRRQPGRRPLDQPHPQSAGQLRGACRVWRRRRCGPGRPDQTRRGHHGPHDARRGRVQRHQRTEIGPEYRQHPDHRAHGQRIDCLRARAPERPD